MGDGTAGKTSLLRALGSEDKSESPLTAEDERTIAVDVAELFDALVVFDFGGQLPYRPIQKIFLSEGALYLIVLDLSKGLEHCIGAAIEHLSVCCSSVPNAVVMVVCTKADAVSTLDAVDIVQKVQCVGTMDCQSS